MNQLPIAVCMVSGAEVERIGRALESVAGWTSEIVVVLNAEVRDGTEELARKYGAKVFREPWKGYLAQKQSAAAKCTQPWLFNLDADEEVSPELRQELLDWFSRPAKLQAYAALSCPRLSWFSGRWMRHGDWYPDRLTRFWLAGRGRWSGLDPHPFVKADGAIGKLQGELRHYSADTVEGRLKKMLHFSDEFLRQHAASGKVPGAFELVARPFWRFVRAYLIRRGCLDGWQGFYIASHTAFATLVRYARLREARKTASPTPK